MTPCRYANGSLRFERYFCRQLQDSGIRVSFDCLNLAREDVTIFFVVVEISGTHHTTAQLNISEEFNQPVRKCAHGVNVLYKITCTVRPTNI